MSWQITKVIDKGLLDYLCPACGNNQFKRIPLNVLDKAVYYLTLGNKANKKIACTNCRYEVLLDKSNKK